MRQLKEAQIKKALIWLRYLFLLFPILIFMNPFLLSGIAFFVLPKILNSTLSAMPINNDIYPIFLHGLLIVASMIFGLYGLLLSEPTKRLNDIINKYSDSFFTKILFKSILFFYALSPLLLLIYSIFLSLNGLAYYGITVSFTTEQINTGHIPVAISNLSIENATYYNQAKNYSETAQGYYNKTLSNAQGSIKTIFFSSIIISGLLAIYLIDALGAFEYIDKANDKAKIASKALVIIILEILFFYVKLYIIFIGILLTAAFSLVIILHIKMSQKRKKSPKKKKKLHRI